ncbi:MAG: hypothetical protein FWC89_10635 [Defluviitaleaceae bacterium]|nr:hypothetical protein [Defluviitaleaceae bacterium]
MKKLILLAAIAATTLVITACADSNSDVVVGLEQRFEDLSTVSTENSTNNVDNVGNVDNMGTTEPFIFPEDLDTDNIITITERFFVNQLFEVLLNHQQYIGRVIQYEGMFYTVSWDDDFFIVYRYMSCCGNEQDRIGFEVTGDFAPFPDNAWVEVTGMLDTQNDFLVLRVLDIEEKAERGSAFVR